LGERLPPALLALPKKGFGVPLSLWFRGALKDFLWDHLTSPRFLERGIVSAPFLRHMLDEHQRGRRNNSHWLWNLLALELWYRETN
jgi:asparagine synthase (glutamine-hydrolysing)